MLFKCLPPGAQIPGRFPGPAHARGRWFTVDIHCHVLTPKAAEMVAGNAAATRHPREVYANERTREVNRQQAERNRIQFTSFENRLADMDRMGIDIQAISPSPNQTYYGADPEIGIAWPITGTFDVERCGALGHRPSLSELRSRRDA